MALSKTGRLLSKAEILGVGVFSPLSKFYGHEGFSEKGNNNNSKRHLMQHLNSPGVVALLYCEVEKRL